LASRFCCNSCQQTLQFTSNDIKTATFINWKKQIRNVTSWYKVI
jgi:hypothetical protein